MLTVRDIMQTDVVTVTPDTSARHLARLLADEEISGVPVLESGGALVGVVSATDLVRLAADDPGWELSPAGVGIDADADLDRNEDDADVGGDPFGFFLPEDSPIAGPRFLEQWPENGFDVVPVADIMTPVTFSVSPDATLPELCDFLVRGRIHRAIVADAKELIGIVTSADVLRAVAEGRLGA